MKDSVKEKSGQFANILLDRWFRRTFGMRRSKRLLTLLLTELIPEHDIVDIDYGPHEFTNVFEDDKDVRVDVECTDRDGTRFVVEMQVTRQASFHERSIYNSTFAVQEQLERGSTCFDFPTVYFIGIMDFSLHEGSDQVLYRYHLTERNSGEIMSSRLQYIFLELPNCSKALTPEATVLDNFCYALHNIASLEEEPEGLDGDIFRLLFNSAKISNFTPQEKAKYDYDMTTERDRINQLLYAKEEGMAQGKAQQAAETARKMLKKGMHKDTISELTGLSKEQIDAL